MAPAALDYLFATGEYAGRNPNTLPELVLLDLKLRRVNGMQVLHRMRQDERTYELSVVILTTSEEQGELAECYRQGANSVVRKPVDLAQFAEAVRKLGCYWVVTNESIPPLMGK